ncbi:hypothetical protein BJX99DRAFT_240069 [Aspergillus californicus]
MLRGASNPSRLFTMVACLHYIFLYPRIPRLQYPRPALHAKSDNADYYSLVQYVGKITSLITGDHLHPGLNSVLIAVLTYATAPLCAFAIDRRVWDPIQVCGMSDPDCTTTCCGKTRADMNSDDSLLELLRKIARLLLCKRNHHARAARVVGRHAWNPRMESQQSNSPLYTELDLVDLTSTPLTPMDVEPAAAEPQSIRMEQLRQRSVQFEVSLSSPARIKFGTTNADNTSTPVILRSLRQDDDSGRDSSGRSRIGPSLSPDSILPLNTDQARRTR